MGKLPTKEEIKERCEVLKVGKGRMITRFLEEIAEEGLEVGEKGTLYKVNLTAKEIIEKRLSQPKEPKRGNISSAGYDMDKCPW